MKQIKVFAFPSHSAKGHSSGVHYARVNQPMKFLNGYKDKDTEFKVDLWCGDPISLQAWSSLVKKYDLVYFNYTVNDWAFAAMGSMVRKEGKKMIMDLDDALWLMNSDNVVYETYKKGSKGLNIVTDIINEVDAVTCTNSYLRNVIANYTHKRHDQIGIMPNYIDLELYNSIPKPRESPFINIVHYGSSTHFRDLKSFGFVGGVDRIMADYPNARFITIGSFFSDFKMKWGERYEEEFGHLEFIKWAKERFPETMEKTDIFVAPLEENNYNKAKSDIKRLEVATAKKPFIGQDIRQYRESITDGVDGMLAGNADDWYLKIKTLIDDPELRKKIGEEGYKRMARDKQMKDHIQEYADFFKKVLTK